MKTAVGGGRPTGNPLIQALLSGITRTHTHTHKVHACGVKHTHCVRNLTHRNRARAITNLIIMIRRFLGRNPFFKDLLYAQIHANISYKCFLSPRVPSCLWARDNYLSTLGLLKGVSKSTQAVCLSGDFLFQHLVEMICLLSPVDLLLSSSAAHYCSHKAARSGERQGGRGGKGREGREGG